MRTVFSILLTILALALGFWLILNFYNGFLGFSEKGDTTVPDLHGKSVQEAQTLLDKASLTFSVSRSEYNKAYPKDVIISQVPDPGMVVKKGRPVQVVVSNGEESITVPDLRGLDLREAKIELENNKLTLGKTTSVTHAVAKKNVVVDQDPLPGKTAQANTAVDLTISVGPPPSISMPQLVGHDLVQAKSLIQEAKLRIGQVGWRMDSSHPSGEVLTQNPGTSQKVHEGDMVSIVMSAGEKTETLPFKQSYITILLPPFDGEQEVNVWVTDETATNLAYRGIHHGRDKIELMVSGYGNSKVEVRLGGTLLSSGQL